MKTTPKLIVPIVTTLGVLMTLIVAVGIQTSAQDKSLSPMPRKAVEEGIAIVLNKTLAPTAELPAEILNNSAETVIQQLREKRLQVFVSDTRRCLAITAARTPTEEEIKSGRIPDNALAALLAGSVTKEQLTKRKKGYLRLEDLSPFQRLIVEQIARHREMINKDGQPTEAGTQLMLGLYPEQVVYLFDQKAEKVNTEQIDVFIQPPTEEAIPSPRLRGSLLWWSWPHATATWGEEMVSLTPGTYSIKDLITKLGTLTSWKVEVDRQVPDVQLLAASRNMPLRKFLWAAAVAAGLQVRVLPTAKVAFLATRTEQQPEGLQGVLGAPVPLFQLPGSGYASPLANEATRELLAKNEDFKSAKGEKTLGWKFEDLPLLYREMLTRDFNGVKKKSPEATQRNSKSAVFWTQGIHVSIGLFNANLAGGGADFFLPAL